MKINSQNLINFKKHLCAKANIVNNSQPQKVNIWEFDDCKKDKKEIDKAKKSAIWNSNYYLKYIYDDFDLFLKKYKIYTIEDDSENILCISVVDESRKKDTDIKYIETAPELSCYNYVRNLRYAGETMLAFLAKNAKARKKNLTASEIALRAPTQKFYKSLGFKSYGIRGGVIERENLDKLIKRNEKHTKSEISVF